MTDTRKRALFCAVCDEFARAWSGAWLVGLNGDEWIGWCSNQHRTMWLAGYQRSDALPAVPSDAVDPGLAPTDATSALTPPSSSGVLHDSDGPWDDEDGVAGTQDAPTTQELHGEPPCTEATSLDDTTDVPAGAEPRFSLHGGCLAPASAGAPNARSLAHRRTERA